MLPDFFDKLPIFVQIAVLLGGLVGGVVMYVRGGRDPKPGIESEKEKLKDAIAAALLRDTASKLREDVGKVLEANREAFFKALADQDRAHDHIIGELEDRVRTMEIEFAGMRADIRTLSNQGPKRRG